MLLPLHQAQAKAAEEARIAAEKAEAERLARLRASYGNNYTWGNCTWYVASRVGVPSSMGNATNWEWGLANAGWHYGVRPGAIGVSHVGWMGHVVYVEAVSNGVITISEMNYFGLGVRDTRVASPGEFVYLYE